MNQTQCEIAIKWQPDHPRSQLWFNVPLHTQRPAQLTVYPRTGSDFLVIISKPQSSWLKLSRRTGKVPFTTTVTVDTTGLDSREGYKEELEFQVEGITIYREPIYLTTQLYDFNNEPSSPNMYALLNPGKPKRNLFVTLYKAAVTIFHISITVVIIWFLLLGITLVMIIASLFSPQ